jgi:hypothetical protein
VDEEPPDSINASDARVFRELLLQIHGDINRALSDVAHAKRTTARMRELGHRAGIGSPRRPITDMLEVAEVALDRAALLVDLGLDAGIMFMREVSELGADAVMRRMYETDGMYSEQAVEDIDPWCS